MTCSWTLSHACILYFVYPPQVWQVAARGLCNDAPRIFLLVVGDCCCHNSQVHWYIEEDQLYFSRCSSVCSWDGSRAGLLHQLPFHSLRKLVCDDVSIGDILGQLDQAGFRIEKERHLASFHILSHICRGQLQHASLSARYADLHAFLENNRSGDPVEWHLVLQFHNHPCMFQCIFFKKKNC